MPEARAQQGERIRPFNPLPDRFSLQFMFGFFLVKSAKLSRIKSLRLGARKPTYSPPILTLPFGTTRRAEWQATRACRTLYSQENYLALRGYCNTDRKKWSLENPKKKPYRKSNAIRPVLWGSASTKSATIKILGTNFGHYQSIYQTLYTTNWTGIAQSV